MKRKRLDRSHKLQVKIIQCLLLGVITFFIATNGSQAQIVDVQSVKTIAQDAETKPLVTEVATVGMTVSNMEEAISFYTQVLPFEVIDDVHVSGREYELLQGIFGARSRIVDLQLGDETIELTEYLTPKGDPIPIDSQSNDLWFQHIAIVVRDMPEAYRQLGDNNVQHVSTYPQELPEYIEAAAGIEAFYFRDPDGHNLELIAYPPDKGDPRWQKDTDDLFLGIDHTAIAVSDTETSMNFYRDLLGLKLAGESENYGTEQEHLNNVFGARLQISGLKAEKGMAVEFLEYIAPPGGRPFPDDSQANDLWHWETTFIVDDIEKTAKNLRDKNIEFISSGVIKTNSDLDFSQGLLIRDPDGHGIKIIER